MDKIITQMKRIKMHVCKTCQYFFFLQNHSRWWKYMMWHSNLDSDFIQIQQNHAYCLCIAFLNNVQNMCKGDTFLSMKLQHLLLVILFLKRKVILFTKTAAIFQFSFYFSNILIIIIKFRLIISRKSH